MASSWTKADNSGITAAEMRFLRDTEGQIRRKVNKRKI
jgi:hypothetical protein